MTLSASKSTPTRPIAATWVAETTPSISSNADTTVARYSDRSLHRPQLEMSSTGRGPMTTVTVGDAERR